MGIPLGIGMKLLRHYAEWSARSPRSTLCGETGRGTQTGISVGLARRLTIGMLISKCPIHVTAREKTGGHRVRWEPEVVMRRTVLAHWCYLWQKECLLKAEHTATRSAKELERLAAELETVQDEREALEDPRSGAPGRAFAEGLRWFCEELTTRLKLAGEWWRVAC